MKVSGGKTLREEVIFSFAVLIACLFFLGIAVSFINTKIGAILISPFIIFGALAAFAYGFKKQKRCVNCSKLLPKNSMFLDYCQDCAKKREQI